MPQKNGKNINCKICNKEFYIPKLSIKLGHRKFCSKKCYYKWNSINIRGNKHPRWKGGKIKVLCKLCKKELFRKKSQTLKFCSRKCYYKWKKGKISPLKGKKNLKITGDKHCWWKGDRANYVCIHNWVVRHKGKPEICKHCGITNKDKRLCWSNKDHTYKRKLEDYIALCYSCHKLYDLKYNLKPNNKIGNNQFTI